MGKLLVAVVYRRLCGKDNSFLFLEEMITFLCSTKLPFLVMGHIKIYTIEDDVYADKCCSLALTYGCTNQITLPTKVTAECATALGICFTSLNSNDLQPGILTSDISDHLLIFCLTTLSCPSDNNKTAFLLVKLTKEH